MRMLVIVGVVLLALGVLSLGYGGFSYITREKVADVGPVTVTADREKTVWIPPVVGGISLAAGALCLVRGARARG